MIKVIIKTLFLLSIALPSFSQDVEYSFAKSTYNHLLVCNAGLLNMDYNDGTINFFPNLDCHFYFPQWIAFDVFADYSFSDMYLNNYSKYKKGTVSGGWFGQIPQINETGESPAHSSLVKIAVYPYYLFGKRVHDVVLIDGGYMKSSIQAKVENVLIGPYFGLYHNTCLVEYNLGFHNMKQTGIYAGLSLRWVYDYAIKWNFADPKYTAYSSMAKDFLIVNLYSGIYYAPDITLKQVAAYAFIPDDEEHGPYTSTTKNTGWEIGLDASKRLWFVSLAGGVLPGPERLVSVEYRDGSPDWLWPNPSFFIRLSCGLNFHTEF